MAFGPVNKPKWHFEMACMLLMVRVHRRCVCVCVCVRERAHGDEAREREKEQIEQEVHQGDITSRPCSY